MPEYEGLETIFLWLENSSVSVSVRQSIWLYPIIEIIHIVGFAILVGSAVMFDLRLLGLARRLPVKEAAHHLTLWSRLSLIAVVPSGFLLFMVDATTIAVNTAFQVKLALIGTAGINAAVFHIITLKTVDSWNLGSHAPVNARISGVVSIIIWVSVIACGRLIAYV